MDESQFEVDPARWLTEHADHLNSIRRPRWFPRVSYEVMSGALVWSDETKVTTPVEVAWALRFLFAHRTELMLGKPDPRFETYWDLGLSLFPRWIGFRQVRRKPTKKLLDIYRRGDVSLRKCLRDVERGTGGDDVEA